MDSEKGTSMGTPASGRREPQSPAAWPERLSGSLAVKFTIVALLVVMFVIPWGIVYSMVSERTTRRGEAAREVSAIWGGPQQVGAVVLTVPYHEPWIAAPADKSRPEQPARDGVVRVLPESLDMQVELVPSVRYRGMFPVTVYTANVKISGRFVLPDLAAVHADPEAMLWDRAMVRIGLAHMKSVNPDAALVWNGARLPLAAAMEPMPGLTANGLEAAVPDPRAAATATPGGLPFELVLEMKGTGSFSFQPAGKVTSVVLSSTWPDASFTGAFLPDSRQSSALGFEARWRVGSFGRGYPQAWREGESRRQGCCEFISAQLGAAQQAAVFGAELVTAVDLYQQTERSVKYGMLFVGLTFLLFLLIELLRGVRVHPVQYVLVGGALLVFYLLLLSLAEQIGFGAAYLTAASATVVLIASYVAHAFRRRTDGLQAGAWLAGLYATLFVLVRLEDYALLAGALLLFGVIAAVMYLTRRVDWYAVRAPA